MDRKASRYKEREIYKRKMEKVYDSAELEEILIQSNLFILTSLTSIYRLSRYENLVPVLTCKSNNR